MTLDQSLLNAHATDDITTLIQLYAQAADQTTDPEAAGFYLTQAYVYALEQGDNTTNALYRRLKATGRV